MESDSSENLDYPPPSSSSNASTPETLGCDHLSSASASASVSSSSWSFSAKTLGDSLLSSSSSSSSSLPPSAETPDDSSPYSAQIKQFPSSFLLQFPSFESSPFSFYANKTSSSSFAEATTPLLSLPSSTEIVPSMMGAGLANLGNTCFLNVILQCFTHTVPLVEGLRSCNHPTPCDRNSEEFCVICALRDHIDLSLASTGGVISPSKLVDNLSYLSSSFQRYQQEDAHEFLQCLLDRLDSCCVNLNKQSQENLSSHENNFVKQVFGGHLRSQLRCCNCGHCSDVFEPLIDLSLEIEHVDSLPSALKSFTNVEKIEDPEIKFTCKNCMEQVSLEKQFTLDQVPSVAAFHLKRFKNDGPYVEKLDKHVMCPLELDLQPYTSSNRDNNMELKYELYAIVVHHGLSPWGGHYFCFIRSSPDAWYKLDDSEVKKVSEETVLSEEAYILFYARQGLPWFSSLMEKQKQFIVSNGVTTSPKSVLDGMDRVYTSFTFGANNCSGVVEASRGDVEEICSPFGSRNCYSEANSSKDVGERVCTPLPLGASSYNHEVDEAINNVDDSCHGVDETKDDVNVNCHEIDEAKNSVNVSPPTSSPGPSSPEIYSEEPPEAGYSIPRSHLRSKSQHSWKSPMNKALEDSKRKEALRLIRTMPTSRSGKFMPLLGPCSEGFSIKKKKHRMGTSASNPFKKPMHAVTAAHIR